MEGKIVFLNRKIGKGYIEYSSAIIIEFYLTETKSKLFTFDLVDFQIEEFNGQIRAVHITLATNPRTRLKRY